MENWEDFLDQDDAEIKIEREGGEVETEIEKVQVVEETYESAIKSQPQNLNKANEKSKKKKLKEKLIEKQQQSQAPAGLFGKFVDPKMAISKKEIVEKMKQEQDKQNTQKLFEIQQDQRQQEIDTILKTTTFEDYKFKGLNDYEIYAHLVGKVLKSEQNFVYIVAVLNALLEKFSKILTSKEYGEIFDTIKNIHNKICQAEKDQQATKNKSKGKTLNVTKADNNIGFDDEDDYYDTQNEYFDEDEFM